MPTYSALTTLSGKASGQALADALERMEPAPTGVGISVVEGAPDQWEVGGYFLERPDDVALSLLCAVHDVWPFVIAEIPEIDWVAEVRRELKPVHAGRFVVFGGHDADNVPSEKIGLQIEAAMAFGTGHHGTTQGCLMAFDFLLRQGLVARNVADIGAGTAVLAMAAAKVLNGRFVASDIDPVATETARANVLANNLRGKIQTLTSVGFRHPELHKRAPFDLVFANILAGPLKKLAPEMAEHTASGAVLILSGILNRQAKGVENTYAGYGFSVVQRRVIGEWTTLTLRKG
ncbi:MAG: 50S ribosomal protein L11 methyltransferase [Rhodobacteraceae bacterium]|nr:50S ribosomal protein L11 methyltransferase [Paracoccaceae bacterium]